LQGSAHAKKKRQLRLGEKKMRKKVACDKDSHLIGATKINRRLATVIEGQQKRNEAIAWGENDRSWSERKIGTWA